MRTIKSITLILGMLSALAGSALLMFIQNDWYGAMGWLIVAGYQFIDFIER